MTESVPVKPPAPPLTRAVQVAGLAAIALGVWVLIEAVDCEELDCLAALIGAMGIAWGLVALMAGLRNMLGFVCLVGAIVLALLMSWAALWFSIPFLFVVFFFLRISKDKLRAFYGRDPVKEDA